MKIEKVEVKTFKTKLRCAKVLCSGEYEFTGEVNLIPGEPDKPAQPAYGHKCTVCGDEQPLDKKFPIISYEEVT